MTTATASTTLGEAIRAATARLRIASAQTPSLDARVLAAFAMGCDTAGLIAANRTELGPPELARYDALVERRAAGEPVARIVGRREFWGLEFAIGPATLVPRPDSETLVQAALDVIDAGPGRDAPLRIADLGTGSGCLLAALLSELPQAIGVGIDISVDALATARDNLRLHEFHGRAIVAAGRWAEPLCSSMDVIVANPPYIESDAIESLSVEVARHEPRAALDGGADGLAAYGALLPRAAETLRPSGTLLLEHGADQQTALATLIGDHGLSVSGIWHDLSGTPRVVACARHAQSCGKRARGAQNLLGKAR